MADLLQRAVHDFILHLQLFYILELLIKNGLQTTTIGNSLYVRDCVCLFSILFWIAMLCVIFFNVVCVVFVQDDMCLFIQFSLFILSPVFF